MRKKQNSAYRILSKGWLYKHDHCYVCLTSTEKRIESGELKKKKKFQESSSFRDCWLIGILESV